MRGAAVTVMVTAWYYIRSLAVEVAAWKLVLLCSVIQESERVLERIDELHLEFAKRAAVSSANSPPSPCLQPAYYNNFYFSP